MNAEESPTDTVADGSARGSALTRIRTVLAESDGLGPLATSRMSALLSEGIHHAALAGVVLFSPERATTPIDILFGFTIMLLPYSLVGPFAAAALDRWDRRLVIGIASALRTILIAVTIVLVAIGTVATSFGFGLILVISLFAIGIGRLINTGLTASIPQVVPPRAVAATNSLLVTAGSGITAAGAALTFAALAVVGAGNAQVAWALVPATLIGAAGAWAVLALPRGHLGPHDAPPGSPDSAAEEARVSTTAVQTFANGLRDGWVAAREQPVVVAALASITLGRAAFGITTMLAILLLREPETEADHGGALSSMGGFGLLMAIVAGGMLLAAVVTPWALERWNRFSILTVAAVATAITQLLVGPTLSIPVLLAGAVFLGLGTQVVKLTGDNTMQTEVGDFRRGSVFALQDALFNLSFVVAMALVLPFVPHDGRSVPLMIVAGILYLSGAVVSWLLGRRHADPAVRHQAEAAE